jgi:transmembrane sensor
VSRAHPASPSGRDVAGPSLLSDPALAEALADPSGYERLSDADIRAMRARRRQAWGSAGAVALVLIVGAGSWRGVRAPQSAPVTEHYATARGQHSEVRLADGSILTLNGATSVAVTLAADRRTVALQAGEAYFDVAHDPSRPFIVRAGPSSAQVLGTAFDLNLTRGQVELDVYRGAVRFGEASSNAGDKAGAGGKIVRAGWRSRFAQGAVADPSPFDTSREGWREGWLDTDGMRLGDVVEAINRQGGPPVLPPPPSLDQLQIAGRFKLDDPAMLLGAVGDAYGFRVQRRGDGLHLEPIAGS